jgi:MurNAc alpha-1-phosphate uridylyltransferase
MAAWDDTDMDALLLLYPTVRAVAYYGMGDYMCDPLGRLRRRREREVAPFIFTGAQILHPRLFEDAPDGAFSLNRLYDRAEEAGRLYAIVHDGDWLDVGTMDRLAHAKRESDASAQGGLF